MKTCLLVMASAAALAAQNPGLPDPGAANPPSGNPAAIRAVNRFNPDDPEIIHERYLYKDRLMTNPVYFGTVQKLNLHMMVFYNVVPFRVERVPSDGYGRELLIAGFNFGFVFFGAQLCLDFQACCGGCATNQAHDNL